MNGAAVTYRQLDPPTSVPTAPTPLTRAIDALPPNAVLLELPFGDISWEIRYLYLSTFHWRRMVNGYSGDVPVALRPHPRRALPAARGGRRSRVADDSHIRAPPTSSSTKRAYGAARAAAMCAWLEARGARLLRQVDEAWIYELR